MIETKVVDFEIQRTIDGKEVACHTPVKTCNSENEGWQVRIDAPFNK
jgi:hypothetical protein